MKNKKYHSRLGFTIIELALVLVLIGILATLAVTTYSHLSKKAKRVQAQIALKHLAKTEYVYYSEFDRYTDDPEILSFDPLKYDYYEISIIVEDPKMDFTGKAVGNLDGDPELDVWVIHKDGEPRQLSED